MKNAYPDFWPEGEELLADVDWLRRLATQLVGDAAGGDDLAQETWATVVAKQRRPAVLRPYLAGVARSLLRERRRKHGRRAEHEARWAEETQRRGAADSIDTESRLDWQALVVHALRRLPERQRQVLMLRFFDQLEPKQIAARLDMPGATVRSQLARGLAQLRCELDAETPGGREAWLAGLAPFIPTLTASRTITLGLGALSMKSLLAIGAALLAFLTAALFVQERSGPRLDLARAADSTDTTAALESAGAAEPLPLVAATKPNRAAHVREVAPSTPSFRGRLVTRDGRKVSGVSVAFFGIQESVTTEMVYSGEVDLESLGEGIVELGKTRTDAEGRFNFEPDLAGISVESLILVSESSKFSSRSLSAGECIRAFDGVPDEPLEIVFDAPPSLGTLHGRVLDQGGVPVEDFKLTVSIPDGVAARSSSIGQAGQAGLRRFSRSLDFEQTRGVFEIDIPLVVAAWDWFEVTISSKGYSTDSVIYRVDAFHKRTEALFELERGSVLRGVVVDLNSNPVAGARVSTWNLVRQRMDGDRNAYSENFTYGERVETGPDGRFELHLAEPLGVGTEGPEMGAECASIRVVADGFPETILPAAELDFGAGELIVRMKRGGRVVGRVLGAEGGEGLSVRLSTETAFARRNRDHWTARVSVSASGEFGFESVPEGLLFATLSRAGSQLAVEQTVTVVSGQETRLEFDLAGLGRLTGEVAIDWAGTQLVGGGSPDDIGMILTLFVSSGDSAGAAGPQPVASAYVGNGGHFDLPSVASDGPAFLRAGVNESWYVQIPLVGLGGDLDLGTLELVVADFEHHRPAEGGPVRPR